MMKTWSFTTEYDGCLATDVLTTIYHLYQHREKNTIQDVEINCKLNDIRLFDEASHSNQENPNLIRIMHSTFKGDPHVDLQYIISTITDDSSKEKTLLIIFKGSKETVDWVTNFAIRKTKFFDKNEEVHLGFQKTIELFEETFKTFCHGNENDLYSNLYSKLKDGNTKIILAGHSLGGSLATLAACRFHDLGIPSENLVVYSFGSPPIASNEFVQIYNDKINVHRFTNTLDIVPYAENALAIFKNFHLCHLGEKIVLPSNEGEVHSIHGYIDNIEEYNNRLKTK